jgi:hypothetical protein
MGASLTVRTVVLTATTAVGVGLGLGHVPAVRAQTTMQPAIIWGWPYGPMLMPWGYWYSPCYPFASCSAYQQFRIWERRQERLEELRRGQQGPSSVGIQDMGATVAARDGDRAKRATNEADVRPDYIDSGRIRDQYAGSGEVLPEFLDRSVVPSR